VTTSRADRGTLQRPCPRRRWLAAAAWYDGAAMPVDLALLVGQIVGMALVFGLALFLAAGTVAWPAGWVFLGLFFGFTVLISAWLARANPGLLTERMTGIGKADQQPWDRLWFAVTATLFLGWLVVMPLDAVRFGWSRVPGWVQALGAVLLLVSFWLLFLVFRENSYLSPAVRVQTDRGQTVVDTGPYGVVRHPMYAAAAVLLVGSTLLLGSWYGLVGALLIVVGVAVRAVNEERLLRAELPGYDEYAARVRYRLVPGVW
jgi:protein-S-isoprenylcysteine O-methyltransferase Ste14